MEIKDKVIKILKTNSEGLTIQEISEKIKHNRITVTTILAKLEGENKVRIRIVGQAKIYYWMGEKR